MMVDDFGLDAGQLMWRRTKIAELGEEKFKREYPNTFDEAFEITGPRVLIGTRMIRAAIERDVHQVDGPIIWGVDCSLGGDASTLAKRRTNKLLEPVKELLQGQASYDTIAVARAVLEVSASEGLLENAATQGAYLLAGVRSLGSTRFGNTRGAGLYLGVDMIDANGAPDAAAAKRVVNGLRGRGVLIGAAGPHASSLKIRPPLPIDRAAADFFLSALADTLAELG